MNNAKQLTGYPSIDKPWLKYYNNEAIHADMPECSIYEYMRQNNTERQDRTALTYMSRNITYGEMFRGIDKATAAFSSLCLKQGEIVTGITITTPEMIYSFYALNRLGVITSWIDPREGKRAIEKKIRTSKSRVCFVFERFWDECRDIFMDMPEIKVIIFSLKDSAPVFLKPLLALKHKRSYEKNVETYQSFLKNNRKKNFTGVKRDCQDVAIMEYTGGTTGESKAVMLTDYNCNSGVEQYRLGGTPLKREHKWLTVGFPFTAYTIIYSMHAPLSFGMTCHIIYRVEFENIGKTVVKHKINHMANTPVLWEEIIGNKKFQKSDFSFLINAAVGADALSMNKEKQINDFLETHNCPTHLAKGYGMTEVAAAISVTIGKKINKPGSVGIPFFNSTVGIFDWDTGKELSYHQEGEVCICGPTVMKGYYNNDEETRAILKKHDDGKYWIHSGDVGYMDEDGFLFIKGRRKRMIINRYGFKMFAPTIENVISQVPGIEKVCIVGADDKNYSSGQNLVAFVIAKQGSVHEELNNRIEKAMKEHLPEFYVLDQIRYVDEFPYTNASKVNYRELEKIAENES